MDQRVLLRNFSSNGSNENGELQINLETSKSIVEFNFFCFSFAGGKERIRNATQNAI